MSKLSLILFVLVVFSACNNNGSQKQKANIDSPTQQTVEGEAPGKIVFEEDFHDFGKLEAGEIVSYTFKFKNEGKSTLLVKQVRPSCGCTAPKYTKTPIPPGGIGEVELGFDSKGFQGMQNKSATVITNGDPSDIKLHFTAVVE